MKRLRPVISIRPDIQATAAVIFPAVLSDFLAQFFALLPPLELHCLELSSSELCTEDEINQFLPELPLRNQPLPIEGG